MCIFKRKDKPKKVTIFRKLRDKLFSVLIQKIEEFETPVAADTQTREALEHSRIYTKFLKIYIKSTKNNIRLKNFFKFIFFIVTMGSLGAIIYMFYLSLDYSFNVFKEAENLSEITVEAILSTVSVTIPALVSLITAFMKIPQIIAQYLFDSKEDDNMKELIKNIQSYDKEVVYKEDIVKKTLAEQKKQRTLDTTFEESPKGKNLVNEVECNDKVTEESTPLGESKEEISEIREDI